MSKLKKVVRAKLTEVLQALTFKPMLFFITSFRATTDGSLQVEVCQNRRLGGRKRTLLGMINHSDKRFGNDTTLLFDWLTFKPEDLLKAFPGLAKEWSLEDLKAIADTYDPDGPKGKKAIVFQALHAVPYKIVDPSTGETASPVIAVTEVTHTQLLNHEFYRGENAQEKVDNELENGNAVMRTGSDEEADYIVDGETGDRIYRFTQTRMQEDYPNQDWDSLIANKTTESQYKKGAKRAPSYADPENLQIPAMVGDEDSI